MKVGCKQAKALVVAGVYLLLSVLSSGVLANDEFLEVNQAFAFSSEQEPGVTLNWKIAKGYYLYKNKIKLLLDGRPLTLNEMPTGVNHEDEFFGQQQVYKNQLTLFVPSELLIAGHELKLRYQGCAEAGLCYPPVKQQIALDVNTASALSTVSAQEPMNTVVAESGNDSSDFSIMDSKLGVSGLGVTLLMFFILGLGLSFTPCVFPMYPILTGIIVGQNDTLSTRRAFMLSFAYVQGMAITYTAMGVIVAFAGMQFQAMFQHPVVLIGLSILFVFLALSMFGVLNLALPSSWQQKLNDLSNKQTGGSYIGVALMGVISGLVASPCTTAPLTAALVYIAQSGDALLGALALYSLSLGMGVPLIILGSSGGNLLPKAGGWMNIVKNVFGFLLLIVPITLVQRLLPEAWSLVLWLGLAAGFGGYLLNLNAQSQGGFWYGLRAVLAYIVLFSAAITGYQTYFAPEQLKSAKPVQFTQVNTLTQLQRAISESKGKPVLVDLYADWCIACKEFEHYTFTDSKVKQELQNWTLLQVDLTDSNNDDNQRLMSYYEVLGLPAILVFNQDGKELKAGRISGYLDAPSFISHVQQQKNKLGK